ncbi:protein phosphatase regulator [Malassezia yamatoensis]|uniref:Protein phosphatase regulator n=1 Tax=Malassezia yamatoensis TaxID=253288 RepID=A0AAJ6CHT0_9BASI|nr:protein phosphatase regulator [Malassezia yamatoensis]
MLSAPDPYPAVGNHNPAPDDAQIESKTPEICVDYLSHEWKDEDVWNSWKAMTKRKNEISNGMRLENASWRTWAKQRGKLKTISPETLNWLKESDVTWLYGPLHGEAKPVPPPKVASTAERLGIDDVQNKKSILKHRTLSELLQQPRAHPSSDDDETPDEGWSKKSELHTVHSEMQLARTDDFRRRLGSPDLELNMSSNRDGPEKSKAKRQISFNNQVEQYIALDYPADGYLDLDDDDDDETDELDSDETTDDDDLLSRSHHQAPSSRSSTSQHDLPAIIARLEPTQLKTGHEYSMSPSPVTNMSGFTDSDDDSYDDEDARYSMADPIPVTQDLALDQDGYDFYASDEDFDGSSPYLQSVSNSSHSATHADTATTTLSDNDTHTLDDPADLKSTDTSSLRRFDLYDEIRGRTPQRGTHRNSAGMIPPYSPTGSATSTSSQEPLVVDVENLPNLSLEDSPSSGANQDELPTERTRTASLLGPTPQNTPDGPIPGYTRSRRTPSTDGGHQVSGALVAPPQGLPAIPLADEYVEENEGGLVSGAVEILNTARDLLGTLMGSSGQSQRSWYE